MNLFLKHFITLIININVELVSQIVYTDALAAIFDQKNS